LDKDVIQSYSPVISLSDFCIELSIKIDRIIVNQRSGEITENMIIILLCNYNRNMVGLAVEMWSKRIVCSRLFVAAQRKDLSSDHDFRATRENHCPDYFQLRALIFNFVYFSIRKCSNKNYCMHNYFINMLHLWK